MARTHFTFVDGRVGLVAYESIAPGGLVRTCTSLVAIKLPRYYVEWNDSIKEDFFDQELNGESALVQSAVSSLSAGDRREFRELSPGNTSSNRVLVKDINRFRYHSQTAPVVDGNGSRRVLLSIFKDLQSINHSCIPNAALGWDHSIRAINPIAEGEEILLDKMSFLDGMPAAKERKEKLEKAGFSCKCSECDPETSEKADQRRMRLQYLYEGVRYVLDVLDGTFARSDIHGMTVIRLLQDAHEYVEILHQMGLRGEKLADAHIAVSKILQYTGDNNGAIEHALKGLNLTYQVWGSKSHERARGALENLKNII